MRSFLGAVQYWRRFIQNFSYIASPLHALTSVKKAFDTLEGKISTVPVLALPDLQQPFEIEIDVSGYAMGAVLMQHRKPICYHSETFTQVVINVEIL